MKLDFKDKLVDLYWWLFKDKKIYKKISDSPETYLIYFPHNPNKKVFVDFFIKKGKAHEEKEEVGLGHLLEHYIFNRISDSFGGENNPDGWIDREKINFSFNCKEKDFATNLEKFLEAILSGNFNDEKILEFEKQAIINESNIKGQDLTSTFSTLLDKLRLSEDHPYARSIVEARDNTSNLGLEDLSNYHKKIMTEKNVCIFIYAHKPKKNTCSEVSQLLEKYSLPKGSEYEDPEIRYSDASIKKVEKPNLEGYYCSLTFPGITSLDPNRKHAILHLVINALRSFEPIGGYKMIRQEGIYDFRVDSVKTRKFGGVSFSSYLAPKHFSPWLKTVSQIIKKWKEDLVPEEYLKRKVSREIEELKPSWRSNNGRVRWISSDLLLGLKPSTLQEERANLESITPELVREFCREIFPKDKMNLLVYGEKCELSETEIQRLLDF